MTIQFMRSLLSRATAARADRLFQTGRLGDAIALVEREAAGDPGLERRAAVWRRDAFQPGRAPQLWPPATPDLFPDERGVPEVSADRFDAERLASGILNHGCLLVRGLIDPRATARLISRVRQAFHSAERYFAGDQEAALPWYAPFPLREGEIAKGGRRFTFEGGGVLAADAPSALSEVVRTLKACGVAEAISSYLGEQPFISVSKTTLRHAPYNSGTGWHQDGSFLGRDIRTVNCWIALTPCGEDAPGLEVYPRRVDLLPTGTHEAPLAWIVGDGLVAEMAREAPTVSPLFEPGDALLFDHRFLHRTGVRPGMTKSRLALESWFFAGSSFPSKEIPLSL